MLEGRLSLEKFVKSNKFYYVIIGILFILGIFLRTKLYLTNDIFMDDECRLALVLSYTKSLFYLGSAQFAPPIFIVISKIITGIFGFTEHVAKLFPYLSGLCSVYYFYKVAVKYLNSKLAVIISMYVFDVCAPLVCYCSAFKQYSSDVLITLICLYYLPDIKLSELSVKKFVFLSIVIVLLPLISLPSLFFIAAFFVLNFKSSLKRFFIMAFPFIILMGAYYYFSLLPSSINFEYHYPNYWKDGFCDGSVTQFIGVIAHNLRYYFQPNVLTLFQFFLWVAGIYFFFCEKSRQAKFILLSFAFILLASLLHVYPLSNRVGLYAISLFLLFIVKPLDVENMKFKFIVIMLLFLSFCKYNIDCLKNTSNAEHVVPYAPETLMYILKDKYDAKRDIILFNEASMSSYVFYSLKCRFEAKNAYMLSQESDEKYLNELKKGHGYWLYLIKEFEQARDIPIILEWLKSQDVKYTKQERKSYLIYLEK